MRLAWMLAPPLIWGAGCGTDGPAKGKDDSDGTAAGLATGTGTGLATGTGTGAGTGTGTGTATGSGGEYIEVGNGEQSHTPAVPGQTVTTVHGPQNGWHIETSGQVYGLGAVVGLRVWIERADNGLEIASNGNQTFLQLAGYDTVGRTGWFAGERNFVEAPTGLPDVCPLDGVAALLCAEAEDLGAPGTLATGCVEVVIALEPADVADCAAGTGGTGTGTGTGTGGTTP